MFGDEITHGTTIDEDINGGVVEGAFEGQGFLGEQAADFEGVCGMWLYLVPGLGFQKEVGWYRASMCDLQGGLGVPEDYSFPNSLGISLMAWMPGCVWLARVQSQAR